MQQLLCTLQTIGFRLAERRRNQDEGQTAAEYLGIIVVVAVIIVAIAGSGVGDTIASDITSKIADIFGAG